MITGTGKGPKKYTNGNCLSEPNSRQVGRPRRDHPADLGLMYLRVGATEFKDPVTQQRFVDATELSEPRLAITETLWRLHRGVPMIHNWLRGYLSDRPTMLYECRRCGAIAESETQTCPQCGHDGIATYELS